MIQTYRRLTTDSGLFGRMTSTESSRTKVFTFPGGETHVELERRPREADRIDHILYLRGATGDDIIALAMINDALKRDHPADKRFLFAPYLPGARADRGSPLGVKVYADMINAMGFERVVCVDPHSDVAPALYDRLIRIDLDRLSIWSARKGTYKGVIAPDLGAAKRAEAVAAKLDVPTYQALKHRDFATGKLSGFTAPEVPEDGLYLVVDDICDGGGTFIGLADAFEDVNRLDPTKCLDLWTTHGIYSNAAIPRLRTRYNELITTDSLAFSHKDVIELALFNLMLPRISKDLHAA